MSQARPTFSSSRAVLCVGLSALGAVVLAGLFGPLISPYPPDHLDLDHALEGPSAAHWLGTDENGADVLTGLLWGARVACQVGLSTVTICALVGVLLGTWAGYRGGWRDELLMRLVDVVMAFPGILLAILVLFVTQTPSVGTVVMALSVTGWASFARLARGQSLALREREYVTAARALGETDARIVVRHIVPNLLAPVIVQATFGLAAAILAEASLSFLGLGAQGVPSWGALLDQGAHHFLITPHLATFPGLAIMVAVLGINFAGDALRDRLDPRRYEEPA